MQMVLFIKIVYMVPVFSVDLVCQEELNIMLKVSDF